MKFAPGQVVRLKSGGQSMTVVAVGEDAIECIWVGEEGDLFRETIPAIALDVYQTGAGRDQAEELFLADSDTPDEVAGDDEDGDDEDDEDDDYEEDEEDEEEDEEDEEGEDEEEQEEDEDEEEEEEEDLLADAPGKGPEPPPQQPRREPPLRGRRKRTVPA